MENLSRAETDNRVTVVIPNYNGTAYLKECLGSLLAGNAPAKVIVVDNGSTDGSVELLQGLCASNDKIEPVFLSENTGFCHAVNVGILRADTEFVFLLNNDTIVEADCLSHLVKVLDENKKNFSAAAKLINMHFPEKLDDAGDFYSALGWAFARGKDKPADKYEKKDRIFASCGAAVLYRKEILDEIGLFDELHFAYLEDIDIGYRANIAGYRNVFVPEAVVYHAGSGVSGSRHNAFKVDLSAKNSVYLVAKNMPFLQILLNLPFLLAGYLIKGLFFLKKGLFGVYVKGLKKGFSLSCSDKGRQNKVPFCFKNLRNYIYIQWELWLGIFRRFF
ncbi:MAG: glycosyltransferase family 2 protein [Lachnospiraceae bacterium]|nr:glycosyltransferase family 2 protein [Lachnospiraceae bacterium]